MASLLETIAEEYKALQILDPGNELLKYFIMNDGVLKLRSDVDIALEFMKRFGPPDTLKYQCKSYKEYKEKLGSITSGNYSVALESTIKFITDKDTTSSIN
jgi:hypothetical protein